ncbi:hypothetical protein B296_00052429 [Ensete ventricosum]|uniref:Uncharacterized protein n=1 Tax=Ensete ventricosum TaxID=4639 RepID=A0A426XNW6_ENSVE|nr:hypothetical protein B296_00052429 [Ensete ventricosum]
MLHCCQKIVHSSSSASIAPSTIATQSFASSATIFADDAVQLCLSSTNGTNEIDIDLLVSSLLPLLVKLAEVPDRERALVAPSSPVRSF